MAIPRRIGTLLIVVSSAFSVQQLFSASSPTPPALAFPAGRAEAPVFVENRGQFDPKVRFQIRVRNQPIWLTDTGLTFDIARLHAAPTHDNNKRHLPEVERSILNAKFINCSKPIAIERLAELPGTYNFFSADPKRSQSNVHAYVGVIYRDLWHGIDLKLYSKDGSNLEQEFIVHRGADLTQIRIRYEKVRRVDIDGDGSLSIRTDTGTLNESVPVIYATHKGIRRSVHGRFVLLGPTEYGFQADTRTDADELLIDPTLLFSTYLGGSNTDWATGVAVDSAGSIYVTGTTASTDFPETNSLVGLWPALRIIRLRH